MWRVGTCTTCLQASVGYQMLSLLLLPLVVVVVMVVVLMELRGR